MCQNQGQAIYTRSARTRIVAVKLNMPNPFFALALGLCTQVNSHQEKWGQAPLRSTLRDSIAALTQWSFSTRTKREQIARAITQQDTFHLKVILKAGTIPATLF
jgi:hypothetical protein